MSNEKKEITPFYGSGIWHTKPWGKYCNLDNVNLLLRKCYEKYDFLNEDNSSGKILVIHPDKKISWQYHFRRDEYWYVLAGNPKIILSHDNKMRREIFPKVGDIIHIKALERHRIISNSVETVIGEIWHHIDAVKSNESDIVRIEDDYMRI